MKENDAQLGKPGVLYKDTKTNIEALSGLAEGSTAYATDSNEFGSYDGSSWTWGQSGTGVSDAADLTYTPAVNADWDGSSDPGNADDAFDQLAERIKDIEDAGIGGGDVIGPASSADGNLAVWDGTDSKTLKDGGVAPIASYYDLCQGRLTLESGVPVSTTDQTAKTTLYFTPYKGNHIGLYNGTSWDVLSFAELSLNISAYTADKNYDIWAYNNSGTVALDSTVWTNDTTRATALALQDGIYVKTGALTRRYLGTIRITGTTGQCADSLTNRYIWNYYNRVNRKSDISSTSSHTLNTWTWRSWNNSTALRHGIIIGVAEETISISVSGIISGTDAYIAVGIDSTTAPMSDGLSVGHSTSITGYRAGASSEYLPAIGYHYFQLIEYGGGGTFDAIYSTIRIAE